MKVLILTQPLLDNYGGILQNYALQYVLWKENCTPFTIDWQRPRLPLWKYIRSWLKTFALRMIGKKRPFAKIKKNIFRDDFFNVFVKEYINKIDIRDSFSDISLNDYDAIVVGSDQVWRPKYNYRVEDMFLKFTTGYSIKRIAYAVSFGVDDWEFSSKSTRECSKLAQKFKAISVREQSGVKLCKNYLGVDTTWVLDPTLLLKKEVYLSICEDIPVNNEKYLALYVFDECENVSAACENESKSRGLAVKKISAGSDAKLTVSEWLAMFRDASFVVTDSFHGTVFSIIFGKEFKCIYNESRGAARFESLLKLYNSGKLDEMREFSLKWLKNALES